MGKEKLMDRRTHPRQDVRKVPIKASLLIEGGSLINPESSQSVEIRAKAVNLSRTGICIVLPFEALWQTVSPQHEVTLLVESGDERESFHAEVIRVQKKGKTMMGLKFSKPFSNMMRFVIPEFISSEQNQTRH
ncbi:MAG: PilZ domain-containing protein [Deltaproteobacteria bacterium]|nr:MAG: PilZ domain-containing protein [Deltaproteobacteria bacterium]